MNEKLRGEEGRRSGADLAFLLHSLFGLDHYPNYLHRWSVEEINKLETALEAQLSTVRAQKAALIQRQVFHGDLTCFEPLQCRLADILHPKALRVYSNALGSGEKCDTISDALKLDDKVRVRAGSLEGWVDDPVIEEVYAFPVFTEEFCFKLIQEARLRYAEIQNDPEASLRSSVDLRVLGLEWVSTFCFICFIEPLSHLLYPDQTPLDWKHAYIVSYDSEQRDHLISHTDDSEVTFNLGLGLEFAGGGLQFNGLRGTQFEDNVQGQLMPRVGWGLLHRGRHLHEVTKVHSGIRHGLIIWTRSLAGVRAETCPCCWLNHRSPAKDCICGAQWN